VLYNNITLYFKYNIFLIISQYWILDSFFKESSYFKRFEYFMGYNYQSFVQNGIGIKKIPPLFANTRLVGKAFFLKEILSS